MNFLAETNKPKISAVLRPSNSPTKELKKNFPCIIMRTTASIIITCPSPRSASNLGQLSFSDCSAAYTDYPLCLYPLNWFTESIPTVTNFCYPFNLRFAYFSPCHLGPTSSNPRGGRASTPLLHRRATLGSIRSQNEADWTWARSDNSARCVMLKTILKCSLSVSFS